VHNATRFICVCSCSLQLQPGSTSRHLPPLSTNAPVQVRNARRILSRVICEEYARQVVSHVLHVTTMHLAATST
jgi:hypothetical protein